jgi:hypothetical protein
MPGSRSERASRTSRKASVRWFVVRAREQGPSNERPDPYRSYLYKVAEKESKSMDINELSLMDVVHLNDTHDKIDSRSGWIKARGFDDNGTTTTCLMGSKLSRSSEGRKTISMGHRYMTDCCL